MNIKALALAGAATAALATSASGQTAPARAVTAQVATSRPAPVAALVRDVNIPYQQFTLPNGLRVVVSTDRKAPVVAVSVWYNVGSKFEPAGKTGFAHLFEHLMFGGSENSPGVFWKPLDEAGATDSNGTTYFDRTNYFETVPTAALDRALFLESDRMGYLSGAVTQQVLDEQRGVVQNEKRQRDNQPYGMAQYKVTEGLFPATHPYGHTTIGSMADLDAASLQTVKDWFHDHYGPNNAVLVLAGDIDLPSARTLVTKYFGAIPAGPVSVVPPAPVPTLPAPVSETMKDRVAATLISRNWAVPGLNDPDSVALDVAAGVLGQGQSSRLYNTLVRTEKLLVSVQADNSSFAQVGTFAVRGIVRPGVDPALAARRIDEVVADFLRTGPTADEVTRVATVSVADTIKGLQSVGGFDGKAVALAEGELYSNDPGFYKKQLQRLAGETPASVKAAADKWLSRPVYALTIVPGPRDAYAEAQVPPKAAVADLSFPTVERARLRNGIEVIYAHRTAVPITDAVFAFDAGRAADVPGRLGTEHFVIDTIDEGTATRTAVQIVQQRERLGMDLFGVDTADRTNMGMTVPSANLLPGVELFADVVRNPAYPEGELPRLKAQALAAIAQELTNPNGLANRVVPRLLNGPDYPYAKSAGLGDPAAVRSLTHDDLVAFQHAWIRPDKLKIFVTSDRPLAEVRAAFDARFGDWQPVGPAGVKDFSKPPQPSAPKIVLVDRPDSPQSVIVAGVPTKLVGTDDLLGLEIANDALGGSFVSRVNMDLRERKHWSYGVSGRFQRNAFATPYLSTAPVQSDQTGASLAALRADIAGYVGAQPMTQEEFDRAIASATRSLSGDFETSRAVLRAMQANDLYKRPDDYYATIAQRYQALTLPQVKAAIRGTIDPSRFVYVIVGDAKIVRPQLDGAGLPVEVVPAAAVAGPVSAASPRPVTGAPQAGTN